MLGYVWGILFPPFIPSSFQIRAQSRVCVWSVLACGSLVGGRRQRLIALASFEENLVRAFRKVVNLECKEGCCSVLCYETALFCFTDRALRVHFG